MTFVALCLFLGVNLFVAASQPVERCLPANIALSDSVLAPVSESDRTAAGVTVEKKLFELNAYCKEGKLFTDTHKEIRFYRTSCWGNPPADYLEILKRERAEVNELRKQYLVLELSCNVYNDLRKLQ